MWGWLKDGLVKRKGIMVSTSSQKNNMEAIKQALISHLNHIKIDANPCEFIQKPIHYDYYAGQINLQSWRFSYGRRAIKRRLVALQLQKFDNHIFNENIFLDLKNNMMRQIHHFISDFNHIALLAE